MININSTACEPDIKIQPKPGSWDEFISIIKSHLSSTSKILDAGAGDCAWKNFLGDPPGYISMDLATCNDAYLYHHLDIVGDLENIPLENESIDIVLNMQVLEHTKHPDRVLQEIFRVLKPGGLLFLSAPQIDFQHHVPHDYFRFTCYGLATLLSETGFYKIELIPQSGNLETAWGMMIKTLSHFRRDLRSNSSSAIQGWLCHAFIYCLEKTLSKSLPYRLWRFLDQLVSFPLFPVGYFCVATKP